ncbi:hypothetical protein [Achromobacter marplatensis]|jgi:hypothetical protein|uniref:hypothetical protein n=1 Tax=Achromobacter marplatensis TaxID=470868 RepID=UPI0028E56A62|nr:hypothetical protein [Achromobacter marplatensis]
MKRSWQIKPAAGLAAPSSAMLPTDDFLDAGMPGRVRENGARPVFSIRPGERRGVAGKSAVGRERYFKPEVQVSFGFHGVVPHWPRPLACLYI